MGTPKNELVAVVKSKNELVAKSNQLIEASYRLNLIEQQIILYAIYRGREDDCLLSSNTQIVIDTAEFAQQFNSGEANIYRNLKEAMATLFDRRIHFKVIDKDTGKPEFVVSRWISEASYIDGAGRIKIIFAPRIIPLITRLEAEGGFTRYRLEKIGGMTSAHAVRLYELLVQYLSAGRREIEIEWLKGILQLDDDYPRLYDFKKWVIDVAVKQINEHSDIRVKYTQRKTGRTVTHLTFEIKPELMAKTEKPTKTSKRVVIDEAYLAKHARPGESRDQAYRRLAEEQGQTRLVA